MIYKCKTCGGYLKFKPEINRLACSYCGNDYSPNEMTDKDIVETIRMNIYTCTSCGGEIAITDKELTGFCPYCGQPNIVFNRISDELKPDRIIPFKISQDLACKMISQTYRHRFYVIRSVRNPKIEMVRGIYVPYWSCDISVNLEGVVWGKKNAYAQSCIYDKSVLRLKDYHFAASNELQDTQMHKLEPFYNEDKVLFNPSYLTGFYANRYDFKPEQIADRINRSVYENSNFLYELELYNRLQKAEGKKQKLTSSKINSIHYELRPIWFFCYKYKGRKRLIYMNGQSGEIGGTPPISFLKVILTFIGLCIPLIPASLLLVSYFTKIFFLEPTKFEEHFVPFLIVLCYAACLFLPGMVTSFYVSDLIKSFKFTRSKKAERFVRERTEDQTHG